jgi:hypothetical protein
MKEMNTNKILKEIKSIYNFINYKNLLIENNKEKVLLKLKHLIEFIKKEIN